MLYAMGRYFLLSASVWVGVDAVALKPFPRSTQQSDYNQSAPEVLPDVSSVLNGPDKLFQTLNTQAGDIQSQLEAMHNENHGLIAQQKAEYERQLEAQRSEIVAAENLNTRMENETKKLQKVNTALRKKASMLAGACHKARLDITQMQNNVTTAMEFMQQTLNGSEELLGAPEVQVMRELHMQELAKHKRLAHVKRVKSIGMLQMSAIRKRSPEQSRQLSSSRDLAPTSLVQGMLNSLKDYTEQKTARENSLHQIFEERFQAGSEQLHLLREEYKGLYTTYQAEKQLQERLVAAVQHLEKTHDQLKRRKQSLARFFTSLGHRNEVD